MAANVEIRELRREDLNRGFLDVLAVLTKVDLSPEAALAVFDRRPANQYTFVAVADNRVLGTTTLLVEQKYIHSGGFAGHIEDVSVSKEAQGTGIGSDLVQFALDEAKRLGCYKVVLHCTTEVSKFYQKLGFYDCNIGMRLDLKK